MNETTLKNVYYRDKCCCVLCGNDRWLERTPHHCFFKSEYFAPDRDDEFNLITICRNCHYTIHFGGSTIEKTMEGKENEKIAKIVAFRRYEGQYKDKLIKILKIKRIKI
jgi:hypothetical protein